jgi:DNA-binding LacI/PurR family transcriptional regulator
MSVTIRSLAELCGVSTATVSRALAGHENVRPATRRKIEEMAERKGYARNQLVGALMAHIRGARSQAFLGNIALLHILGPGQIRPGTQQRRIIGGAQARARELGYQLYLLSLAEKDTSLDAVVRILRARGVPFKSDMAESVPCRF